jgi:hypothetical protein
MGEGGASVDEKGGVNIGSGVEEACTVNADLHDGNGSVGAAEVQLFFFAPSWTILSRRPERIRGDFNHRLHFFDALS